MRPALRAGCSYLHELEVLAALHKRRDYVYHACLLDPHAASVLPMDKIVAMIDELIAAHSPHLGYLS